MAYIGNQPAPSNVNSDSITDGSIKNADIAPDAAIDVSKLDGVTATNTELNKLDGVTATTADLNVTAGADAAGVTASDIQKTQYLSGVSSDVQTQLDNAAGASVKGTLTKSFTVDETATINLSAASTPTPIVSVTKEVPQSGVSSKGNWDVNSSGSNYDIEDTATATTLTPSVADDDGVFTLGSGSFASTDVGKRIVGNGGEAVLKTTAGAYELVTAFNDTSTIASGDWEMYAVKFDGTKAKLSGFFERANTESNITNHKVISRVVFPKTGSANMYTFELSPDSKKMFIANNGQGGYNYQQIWSVEMETAFDLSEAWINLGENRNSNQRVPEIGNLTASNDGNKVFEIDVRDNYNITNVNRQVPTQAFIHQRAANKRYVYSDLNPDNNTYWDGENVDSNFNKIRFYNSGADIFMMCTGTSSRILKYAAVTANSIDGLSTSSSGMSQTLDISGNVGTSAPQTPKSFVFSDDGYHLYISDSTTSTMFHYQLTTAFDLTTASYVGSQVFTTIYDFRISSDGTKILWITNNDINVTTLSSAYSIATLGSTDSIVINSDWGGSGSTYVRDIRWADSGRQLFYSLGDTYIRKAICTEPYNLRTAKIYIASSDTSKTNYADVGANYGLDIASDGLNMIWTATTNTTSDTFITAPLSTAFNLGTLGSTSTFTETNSSSIPIYFPRIQYNTAGTTQFVYSMASDDTFFQRYTFGTEWTAGTLGSRAVQVMNEASGNRGGGSYGLAFNDSCTSFVSMSNDTSYTKHRDNGNTDLQRYYYPILSYSFSKGGHPNQSNHNASLALNTNDINVQNMATYKCPTDFNSDGTNMLVTTWSGSDSTVSEVKLESSYSIASTLNRDATNAPGFQYTSPALSGHTGTVQGIAFSDDGTKLFYIAQNTGTNNPNIHMRTLSTPWDLTTLSSSNINSYNASFSSIGGSERIRNLTFTEGGRYFWTWNGDDGTMCGVRLGTPYDLTSANATYSTGWNSNIGSLGGTAANGNPTAGTGQGNAWCFSPNGDQIWFMFRNSSSTTSFYHCYLSLRKNFRPDQGYTGSRNATTSGNLIYGTSTGGRYPEMAFYTGNQESGYFVGAYRGDYFNQDTSDQVTNQYDPVIFRTYASSSNTYPVQPAETSHPGNMLARTRLNNFMAYASDAYLTPNGEYLFIINTSGNVYRVNVKSEYLKDVTPHDQYIPLITNNTGQINTSDWTDINSMDADDGGDGTKYYAFSTDGRTTFKISDNTNGTRNIIRDNSGTWQYNSNITYGSESWTNATSNTIYSALRDALAVTQNQMTTSQLEAVSDAQFFATGSTFDLAIILRSSEGIDAAPYSDGVSVNYDATALNKGAVLGTDYDYDVPSSTSVRITSLAAQNLKVKVL